MDAAGPEFRVDRIQQRKHTRTRGVVALFAVDVVHAAMQFVERTFQRSLITGKSIRELEKGVRRAQKHLGMHFQQFAFRLRGIGRKGQDVLYRLRLELASGLLARRIASWIAGGGTRPPYWLWPIKEGIS